MVISAFGHPNITSTHKTTLQVTKEDEITKKADCIIGVRSSHSTADLPPWFKFHLRSGGKIKFTIKVAPLEVKGEAFGLVDLALNDPIDIVFRKSDFNCPRTIATSSDLSASDLPKEMIDMLQDSETQFQIALEMMND